MRVIIAGSRDIKDYSIVKRAIAESGFTIDAVVSGTAYGVDKLGEKYARENKLTVTRFIPDWKRFGKSAGPRRNEWMAKNADALIAVMWEDGSPGTKNMIELAKKYNLPIYIHLVERDYETIQA